MKLLYLDCFSGISGDMMLGALVDAGLPIEDLSTMLASLPLEGWSLATDPDARDHRVGGTSVIVGCPPEEHVHRTFRDIRAMIEGSTLPPTVQQRAVAVFHCLAIAEGKVHGKPAEEVGFHEVGAVDSIIDIVGAVAGLHLLGIERIHCSPLPLGSGTVRCQHGLIPVPAPATVEVLRGCPTYAGEEARELVTPTGAAIAKVLADEFGPLPAMQLETVGYGLGKARGEVLPNALRVLVGTSDTEDAPQEVSTMLEANIDDLSPQFFGPLSDRLLAAGAQDVFLTAVQMKKGRPGVQISVLCSPERRTAMEDLLFRETTTIGVRRQQVWRSCLQRRFVTVETPYGKVSIKESYGRRGVLNQMPEFEDCRRLADEHDLPVLHVHNAAVDAARRLAEENA